MGLEGGERGRKRVERVRGGRAGGADDPAGKVRTELKGYMRPHIFFWISFFYG